MNENKFSQIIKELRKKNNLTQQQLADIVGITATGVSYWESGNATPNTETLNKLSNSCIVIVGNSISFSGSCVITLLNV